MDVIVTTKGKDTKKGTEENEQKTEFDSLENQKRPIQILGFLE